MPAVVTLRVTRGPLRGKEFTLAERTTCILGRAPGCAPRLPDDQDHRTISRHHCLLDVNPPDVRIRDFGSLNGTYVNGVKIGQREEHQTPQDAAALRFPEHDLNDGDEIRLGPTVLQVTVTAPPTCTGCGRPLDDADNDNPARCPTCRTQTRVDPRGVAPTHAPRPCANCGRAVGEDHDGRGGDVLCAACHAHPERLARHLLERAGAGDRGLAPVQGYRLLRELGRGGMGAVFLAHHEESGRQVALKLMLPRVAASAQAQQRFLREIQLTRTLRHRNIAAVYDAGGAQGGFYFTTEYCAGDSVDRVAARRGGSVPVDQAVRLTLQALEGLEHAHSCGVVHRDLSPQNILLSDTGPEAVAKICDFGLAKAFDLAGLSGLTRTGTTAGKPHFMPRQQIINFKNAQPEVDTWAIAACLYWLLTGRYPRDFPAHRDPWQVVLQDRAVPIRQRDPSVPKTLAEVIDEALRDRPAIGFRTATALRRALQRALKEDHPT